MPIGTNGQLMMPQCAGFEPWVWTIRPGSSVPISRKIDISERPIATSYDIICDDDRRPPSSAHLL